MGADIPSAPGWRVLERLGEGGFGEVWRVVRVASSATQSHDNELEKLPAGTQLAFKFCFDLAHARALRREATLFKLLQTRFGGHPNIVRLVDFQLERAPLFLAMECVNGGNLADWLKGEGGRLPILERTRLMIPLAKAIHEAHLAGVLLNDIKPSNILVEAKPDGSRHLLLTDLGIGKLRDRSALGDGITKTTGFTKGTMELQGPGSSSGGTAGTLMYLAPELLEGSEATTASDAYAFGVTLMQVAAANPRLAVSDRWTEAVKNLAVRRLIRGCSVAIRSDGLVTSAGLQSCSRGSTAAL